MLHALANLDFIATGSRVFPPYVSLRILRLLRLPHLMSTILYWSDTNKRVATAALIQVALLGMSQYIHALTGGLINSNVLVLIGFAGLAGLSVIDMQRKAAIKAIESAVIKPSTDLQQNLDEICQQIIEKNGTMKK